jgi:hypothetical protein
MRARFVALAMAAAFVQTAALAADPVDPARLAEARALIKAQEIDKQLDQLITVMSQTLSQQLVRSGGVAGRNPRVAQIVIGESLAMSRDNAVKPGGLIDTVVQVYAEKFSLEELQQLRVFYESPVAKRLQEETPAMMQRVIQQSVAMSQEMMPGLCARVKLRLQQEKLEESETFSCPAVWS